MAEDFGFDDVEYDDNDLEFGSFDSEDSEMGGGGRTPTTTENMGRSLLEGAIGSATDNEKIKTTIKDSLPASLANNWESADDVIDMADKAKDNLINPIRKEMVSFKRNVNKLTPLVTRYLGEGVGQKFNEFTGTPAQREEIDPDTQELTSTIGGIFNEESRQRVEGENKKLVWDIMERQTEEDRFKLQMTTMHDMMSAVRRMDEYNRTINFSFQQKSLEYDIKRFHLLKQILEVNKQVGEASVTHLKSIVHNTSLPELVKQQNSELFQQMFVEKWYGETLDSVVGMGRNMMRNFGQNIASRASATSSSIVDSMRTVGDLAETVGDMSDGMADEDDAPPVDPKQEILKALAKNAGSSFINNSLNSLIAEMHLANKDKDWYKNVVAQSDNIANNKNLFFKTFIEDMAKAEGGLKGMLAPLFGILAEDIPETSRAMTSIGHLNSFKPTDPRQWDQQSRTSLVDVIPGWLERIHNLVAEMMGKEVNIGYDNKSGAFIDKSIIEQNILDSIITDDERKEALVEVDNVIDKVTTNIDNVGDADRQLLREWMIREASTTAELDIRRLQDASSYEGLNNSDPEAAERISAAFKEAYNEDTLYRVSRDSLGEDDDNRHLSGISKIFGKAVGMYSDDQEMINSNITGGGSANLHNLGIRKANGEIDDLTILRHKLEGISPNSKAANIDLGSNEESVLSSIIGQITREVVEVQERTTNTEIPENVIVFPRESVNTRPPSNAPPVSSDGNEALDYIDRNSPILHTPNAGDKFDFNTVGLETAIKESVSELVGIRESTNAILDKIKGDVSGGIRVINPRAINDNFNDSDVQVRDYLSGILTTLATMHAANCDYYQNVNEFELGRHGLSAKVKRIIEGGLTGLGSMFSFGKEKIGKLFNFGSTAMGSIQEGFRERFSWGTADVYVGDETTPRITRDDFRQRPMFLRVDGEVNDTPIRHHDGIIGEIVDENQMVIISQAEYDDGLVRVNREGVMKRLGGAFGGLAGKGIDLLQGTFNIAGLGLGGARKALDFLVTKGKSFLDKFKDVYIFDEDGKPKLLASLNDFVNGKILVEIDGEFTVVKSLGDLFKGNIFRLDENNEPIMIATMDDIKRGLIDIKGKMIERGSELAEMAGDLFNKGAKGVVGLAKLPFTVFGNMWKTIQGKFESKFLDKIILNIPKDVLISANVVYLNDKGRDYDPRGRSVDTNTVSNTTDVINNNIVDIRRQQNDTTRTSDSARDTTSNNTTEISSDTSSLERINNNVRSLGKTAINTVEKRYNTLISNKRISRAKSYLREVTQDPAMLKEVVDSAYKKQSQLIRGGVDKTTFTKTFLKNIFGSKWEEKLSIINNIDNAGDLSSVSAGDVNQTNISTTTTQTNDSNDDNSSTVGDVGSNAITTMGGLSKLVKTSTVNLIKASKDPISKVIEEGLTKVNLTKDVVENSLSKVVNDTTTEGTQTEGDINTTKITLGDAISSTLTKVGDKYLSEIISKVDNLTTNRSITNNDGGIVSASNVVNNTSSMIDGTSADIDSAEINTSNNISSKEGDSKSTINNIDGGNEFTVNTAKSSNVSASTTNTMNSISNSQATNEGDDNRSVTRSGDVLKSVVSYAESIRNNVANNISNLTQTKMGDTSNSTSSNSAIEKINTTSNEGDDVVVNGFRSDLRTLINNTISSVGDNISKVIEGGHSTRADSTTNEVNRNSLADNHVTENTTVNGSHHTDNTTATTTHTGDVSQRAGDILTTAYNAGKSSTLSFIKSKLAVDNSTDDNSTVIGDIIERGKAKAELIKDKITTITGNTFNKESAKETVVSKTKEMYERLITSPSTLNDVINDAWETHIKEADEPVSKVVFKEQWIKEKYGMRAPIVTKILNLSENTSIKNIGGKTLSNVIKKVSNFAGRDTTTDRTLSNEPEKDTIEGTLNGDRDVDSLTDAERENVIRNQAPERPRNVRDIAELMKGRIKRVVGGVVQKGRDAVSEPVFGDTDGDGIRENSWRDILKESNDRRKAISDAKKARKAEDRASGKKGAGGKMLGLLVSGMGALLTGITSLTSGVLNIGGTLLSAGLGLGKLVGQGAWAVLRPALGLLLSGTGKVLGAGLSAGKVVATKVGQTIAKSSGAIVRVAKPLVQKAAVKVATKAATLYAGAALAATPIGWAIGVAAIGWTAWEVSSAAWAYFDRRKDIKIIEYLRHLQYGMVSGDKGYQHLNKISLRYFEGEILSKGKVTDEGRIEIDATTEEIWEEYRGDFEDGGDDENKRAFVLWYESRFLPVFYKWMSLTYTTNAAYKASQEGGFFGGKDDLTLQGMDENLPNALKGEVAKQSMLYPELTFDPLVIMSSPSSKVICTTRRADCEKFKDKILGFIKGKEIGSDVAKNPSKGKTLDPSDTSVKPTTSADKKRGDGGNTVDGGSTSTDVPAKKLVTGRRGRRLSQAAKVESTTPVMLSNVPTPSMDDDTSDNGDANVPRQSGYILKRGEEGYNLTSLPIDAPTPSLGYLGFIKKSEGFSPKAFWDHKQYSIGYGTKTTDPQETSGKKAISEAEAEKRLVKYADGDREYIEKQGAKQGLVWAPEELDALTSFTYNLGRGNLNRLIKNRNKDQIANAMPLYSKASGKVLPGLLKRRHEEVALFESAPEIPVTASANDSDIDVVPEAPKKTAEVIRPTQFNSPNITQSNVPTQPPKMEDASEIATVKKQPNGRQRTASKVTNAPKTALSVIRTKIESKAMVAKPISIEKVDDTPVLNVSLSDLPDNSGVESAVGQGNTIAQSSLAEQRITNARLMELVGKLGGSTEDIMPTADKPYKATPIKTQKINMVAKNPSISTTARYK